MEAEKAQTAARLAAGVAHEVRNPLNILGTGIELFSADPAVSGDETNSVILAEMRDAIHRADRSSVPSWTARKTRLSNFKNVTSMRW